VGRHVGRKGRDLPRRRTREKGFRASPPRPRAGRPNPLGAAYVHGPEKRDNSRRPRPGIASSARAPACEMRIVERLLWRINRCRACSLSREPKRTLVQAAASRLVRSQSAAFIEARVARTRRDPSIPASRAIVLIRRHPSRCTRAPNVALGCRARRVGRRSSDAPRARPNCLCRHRRKDRAFFGLRWSGPRSVRSVLHSSEELRKEVRSWKARGARHGGRKGHRAVGGIRVSLYNEFEARERGG